MMIKSNKENPVSTIRYRAMSLLARREHSFLELSQKLKERFPENIELVREIVVALNNQNLQSDKRFSEMLVATRIRRGYGPIRIQVELKQRGVKIDLIDLALIESEADWFQLAKVAMKKKYGLAACDQFDDMVKLKNFLKYRGFKPDHIAACFN